MASRSFVEKLIKKAEKVDWAVSGIETRIILLKCKIFLFNEIGLIIS